MSRTQELEAELLKARARIAELEKANAEKPLTIRRMKAEIAEVIGEQLNGGDHNYCSTVSRSDLLKIHTWVLARAHE